MNQKIVIMRNLYEKFLHIFYCRKGIVFVESIRGNMVYICIKVARFKGNFNVFGNKEWQGDKNFH